MQSLILFDDDNWQGLLPLTFTKPICELRVGILSIREKWERRLKLNASFITQDFLSEKFPLRIDDDNLIINSTILPTDKLISLIKNLEQDEALLAGDELLAARLSSEQLLKLTEDQPIDELKGKDVHGVEGLYTQIIRPYDLFTYNGQEIISDFELITAGRNSKLISNSNRVLNFDQIFIEEGASVELSILNAENGPIYIGADATVMEGSIIRGPFAMCENSVVKMGAKIYKDTTVGPYAKAGGEINNSILSSFSNKGHDGYLGNSILGEWCNLGADTNTSNLKNNYDEIKVWNYNSERFEKSGLQFCGLIMGDHSKCGINTMFNTGTVVGVSTNIFGSGYPRNFIPSFSWGGAKGYTTYQIAKALDTAGRVMVRRNMTLSDVDINILKHVFFYSAKWRNWEN
jgi:UDP-N-acetylglucosamine diphosphorylase/glucosamine-1-phosphate N-acetyltransferase